MHEFSIALNIVEIAEAEAVKADAKVVTELDLDIGTLSGIEFYALETAMEMAVRDSMLAGAAIRIHRIQARAKCKDCQHEFDKQHAFDCCPACGGLFHDTLKGKELKVRSLVVE